MFGDPEQRKPRTPAARKQTVRTKDGGTIELSINRGMAIKLMCTECSGWGEFDPKDCTSVLCPLYQFRGKTLAAYHSKDSLK